MKDINGNELLDCAGCTDQRSEGTHSMHTKQHPCKEGGDPKCGSCFPEIMKQGGNMKQVFDKSVEERDTAIRQYVVNICGDCYELRGQMCNNPDCIFIRHTMDEVREMLNVMLIRPIVDGKSERLGTTLEEAQLALIDAEIDAVDKINWRNAGLGNTPHNSDIIDYYETKITDHLTHLKEQREIISNS